MNYLNLLRCSFIMRFFDWTGHYELESFPGCNNLVVSTHTFIKPELRGKGLGLRQHGQRLKQAEDMGYGYIICTVKANNDAEKHILEKAGWKKLDSFTNKETGNNLEIWGRSLCNV